MRFSTHVTPLDVWACYGWNMENVAYATSHMYGPAFTTTPIIARQWSAGYSGDSWGKKPPLEDHLKEEIRVKGLSPWLTEKEIEAIRQACIFDRSLNDNPEIVNPITATKKKPKKKSDGIHSGKVEEDREKKAEQEEESFLLV